MSHSNVNNLLSLAIDPEGQMARFVATLTVDSSCTNLLYLGTEAVVDVTEEVSFDNQIKQRFEVYNHLCLLEFSLYLVQCPYPYS